MKDKAINYFLNEGFSCSESIVMAAADKGLVPVELVNAATGFSGGMGSGCLCGAISGSQIVIGYLTGKFKSNTARALSKKFLEEFKKAHNTTCCRVLTKNFKENFHSKERKDHCVNMVEFSAKLLEDVLAEAKLIEEK